MSRQLSLEILSDEAHVTVGAIPEAANPVAIVDDDVLSELVVL